MASIARNIFHDFGSEKWKSIPFEDITKNVFDLLVDILFSLSRCLTVAVKMIESSGEKTNIFMAELDRLLQDLVSQIRAWSKNVFWFNSPNYRAKTCLGIQESSSDILTIPFRRIPFYNLPTAALSALYDTTNMITLSLLSISSSEERYEKCVLLHAESILSTSKFINGNNGPESLRGSIMSLFPLKVVSIWSPSSKQRDQAAEMITILECSEQFNSVISNGFFEDLASYIHHRWQKLRQ